MKCCQNPLRIIKLQKMMQGNPPRSTWWYPKIPVHQESCFRIQGWKLFYIFHCGSNSLQKSELTAQAMSLWWIRNNSTLAWPCHVSVGFDNLRTWKLRHSSENCWKIKGSSANPLISHFCICCSMKCGHNRKANNARSIHGKQLIIANWSANFYPLLHNGTDQLGDFKPSLTQTHGTRNLMVAIVNGGNRELL